MPELLATITESFFDDGTATKAAHFYQDGNHAGSKEMEVGDASAVAALAPEGHPLAPGSEPIVADDVAAKPLQGKLPDGFPGKAALEAAGVTTYAGVRHAGDLTTIDGIGQPTADKIAEAMQTAPADDGAATDGEGGPTVN